MISDGEFKKAMDDLINSIGHALKLDKLCDWLEPRLKKHPVFYQVLGALIGLSLGFLIIYQDITHPF